MTKPKMNITYTMVVVAALAVMLISSLASPALAAKTGTSGVHFQGPAPIISCSGTTCSVPQSTLAGLGQGTGTELLTVSASFATQCRNNGGNVAPGQNDAVTQGEARGDFTANNGKAILSPLSATAGPPTQAQLDATCPNPGWTGELQPGDNPTVSATFLVTFNGQFIYQDTFP